MSASPSHRFIKMRPLLSERANWTAMLAEHHHAVRLKKVWLGQFEP